MAREEFSAIQQDDDEFQVILAQIGLQEASSYTDDQQLAVFREYKRLNAVLMEASHEAYTFELRVGR